MATKNLRRKLRSAVPSAIDVTAAGLGAALTTAFPTPEGAALVGSVTTAIAQVAKGFLTVRQESRIDQVLKLADKQIRDHVQRNGPGPPGEASSGLGALLEGTLLTARDSFEEKKIPLLANLVATAPFTNTPAANLIDTLQLAERLTYRQLCILSVIPAYDPDPRPPLTDRPISQIFQATTMDEGAQGVLHDVLFLVAQRLVAATRNHAYIYEMPITDLIPRDLRLTYPARIAVNGMRLMATIPADDLREVLNVIGGDTNSQTGQETPAG